MGASYRDGAITMGVGGDPGFDGLADEVCELLDRVQVTPALDAIWQRIRSLNAFVTNMEPWKMAKDPERAGELDEVLYRLCEGLRVISLLLHPWIPDATSTLLDALGEERRSLDAARFGDWPGGTVSKIDPLFPRIEE
jgi:methionyl-tRNA synthetase